MDLYDCILYRYLVFFVIGSFPDSLVFRLCYVLKLEVVRYCLETLSHIVSKFFKLFFFVCPRLALRLPGGASK